MTPRFQDLPVRWPVLVAAAFITAVVAHLGIWYFVSQYLGLSSVIASILVALVVLKHLGWIGGAIALLRRRCVPPE